MQRNIEKIMATFNLLPLDEARKLWENRLLIEDGMTQQVAANLAAAGFIPIDVDEATLFMPDGRQILRVGGMAVVISEDEHARRKENALLQAEAHAPRNKREAPSPASESMVAVACPQIINGVLCGGNLNRTNVCSSCENGKAGYRYRYACDACSFDVITKQRVPEWA